jgi:hypothetical protein
VNFGGQAISLLACGECRLTLKINAPPAMSASASAAVDAVAFQLSAALEKYGHDAEKLIRDWPDMDLYREVSTQIDGLRMYSSALPHARVQWVELLIAHAELVHGLWRCEYGAPASGQREQLAQLRERHADCVAALRSRCLRVITGSA